GGREHALAKKISESPLCAQLFCAPGNPGTALVAQNVPIPVNQFETIAAFCLKETITMIVVGPEDPLVAGIYNYFTENPELSHIQVVGPSKQAAQLEGSKAFAKAFMARHGIPTAAYAEFTAEQFEAGCAYIRAHALPIVLKADGLAAGKGVVIAQSHQEALDTFHAMLKDKQFGDAGNTVVIEQFLDGIECSMFVLTDGQHYVLLPNAKDYKRIGEGDTRLNTGGMGAVSPVPFVDDTFTQKVIQQIIEPTVNGLSQEGLVYQGFIFFGLIKVNNEPWVIEYNCRMGDPETEAVLPRITSDFAELMLATGDCRLNLVELQISAQHAATIMLVSKGYPGEYEKGKVISGSDTVAN
ncbi:MAG: phosphoribosylamine--glycine ligase, partial [Chitinophagaceae bacterium]|nr:phosphoribosylamine--glycine ligase [Chitinophagaceae bacterium]